jgi:hypothetical protein
MQLYKNANCDTRVLRIDSTQENKYPPNKCHRLPGTARSIEGIAHGKYVLTWYNDDECKDFMAAAYVGQRVDKKDLPLRPKVPASGKWYSPSSFKLVDNFKNPGIPFPQYMECLHDDLEKYPRREQNRITEKACDEVQRRCGKTKKGACRASPLRAILRTGSTLDDVYCLITEPQAYKWFSNSCKSKKNPAGYKCARDAVFWGHLTGYPRSIACNDPQPVIRFEKNRVPFLGHQWGKAASFCRFC